MIVYDWLTAHAVQIAATLAVVNTLLRLIPAATWAGLESNWPRVAHFARVLRAAGPDIVKTAKALWGIWTGLPWPSALTTIEDTARKSMVPQPIEPKDGAK